MKAHRYLTFLVSALLGACGDEEPRGVSPEVTAACRGWVTAACKRDAECAYAVESRRSAAIMDCLAANEKAGTCGPKANLEGCTTATLTAGYASCAKWVATKECQRCTFPFGCGVCVIYGCARQ
jgi:hypothetical protein